MTRNRNIHKAIGWGVTNHDPLAHYWTAGHRGMVAMSYCWLTVKPQEIRPTQDQERCAVCGIIAEEKEDPSTIAHDLASAEPQLVLGKNE